MLCLFSYVSRGLWAQCDISQEGKRHLKTYRAQSILNSSGGSKGGGARGTRAPPLAQNFFIFMQFTGKIDQIIGWRLPLGFAPSSGKSWIRHCTASTGTPESKLSHLHSYDLLSNKFTSKIRYSCYTVSLKRTRRRGVEYVWLRYNRDHSNGINCNGITVQWETAIWRTIAGGSSLPFPWTS